MEADLAEITSKVTASLEPHIKQLSAENVTFRRMAASHNESVKRSVKDIYNVLAERSKDIQTLNDTFENNSQQTQQVAFEVRNLGTMFQQSVMLQFQLIQEIKNLERIVQNTAMQQISATNQAAIGNSKQNSFLQRYLSKGNSVVGKVLGKTPLGAAGLGGAIGAGAGVAGAFGYKTFQDFMDSRRGNRAPGETIEQSYGRVGQQSGANRTFPGGYNRGPGVNGRVREENTGALKDIDPNQLSFLRGIGAGETGYNQKEAYSDVHNSPNDVYDAQGRRIKVGNANVRKYGDRGADYGYYQNNEMDVEDAIKHGVPPEVARHLHGGGQGGKSTIQEQTLAMHEYIKRKYPEIYEGLKSGTPEAFEAARRAMEGKWFALRNNRPEVQEGFNRRYGDRNSIFPEVVDKDKLKSDQGNIPPQVQNNRPDYWQGQLTLGDQTYRYGTGAPGANGGDMQGGSIPYGQFNIKPGLHYGQNPRFQGNSFYVDNMFDSKWGRQRVGVLLHSARDLDKLYTAGCLGIDPRQWPAFKKHLLEQMQKHGEMVLQVNPNGSANIIPKSQLKSSLPTQGSDEFVKTGKKTDASGLTEKGDAERTFFDTNRNYTKPEIDAMIKEHGRNIAIGGNPENEGYNETKKYVESQGAQSHNYYAGKGEPADGYNGDGKIQFPSDQEEIKKRMAEMGYTTRKQWDDGGWKEWHRKKLLEDKPHSFEWDNPSYGKDPGKMLQFLGDHQNWANKNNVTSKMFMKNLSPKQWEVLSQAFDEYDKTGGKSGLNRNLFSKSGFAEYERDNSHIRSVESAARAGVQIYPSMDPNGTNYYATPKGGIPSPTAPPIGVQSAPIGVQPAIPAPPPIPQPTPQPPPQQPPPASELPLTREKTSDNGEDKGTVAGWVPSLVKQVEGYYNSSGRHTTAAGVE